MRKVFSFQCSVFSLMVMAIAGTADARVWTAGVAGNDDQGAFVLSVSPDPDSRTAYRAELSYWDGIRDGTQEAIGLAAGVTYDIVQDVNIPIDLWKLGTYTVKATGYVGGLAGGVANIHGQTNYDFMAVGLMGIGIGDRINRASIEFSFPIDKILDWDNAINLDYAKQIRLVFLHRFK